MNLSWSWFSTWATVETLTLYHYHIFVGETDIYLGTKLKLIQRWDASLYSTYKMLSKFYEISGWEPSQVLGVDEQCIQSIFCRESWNIEQNIFKTSTWACITLWADHGDIMLDVWNWKNRHFNINVYADITYATVVTGECAEYVTVFICNWCYSGENEAPLVANA